MENILILGGAGYTGSALTHLLVKKKYNVTVEKVRTQIYGPERKTKYTKNGLQKTKSNIKKKAIVKLVDGETIDFYNNL